jgi:ChrR Cupin-like domain
MQEPDSSLSNFLDDFNAEDITAMSYIVPLISMPKGLKSRLMTKLNLPELPPKFIISPDLQRLFLEPVEALIEIANAIESWQFFPAPEGATYTPWKIDAANRQVAFFLRVPTAGKLPSHRHVTGEVILVLDGDFSADGVTYKKGDRSICLAGTSHQPTTQGCLVLCISSLDDEVLDIIVS